MPAVEVNRQPGSVTIQMQISLAGPMLATEIAIQEALNEAGVLATAAALQQFDTDGTPVQLRRRTWYSKGRQPCTYQTPYGEVVVQRHVYQTAEGGLTFCPLEREARIILTATPRLAQQVSNKYAEMPGRRVVVDLVGNHGRRVSLALVQDLAAVVAGAVQAKEQTWQYTTPRLDAYVRTVSIGVDGTCRISMDQGELTVLVGAVTLHGRQRQRLHTVFVAVPLQQSKELFFQRLDREIAQVRSLYPRAEYTGLGDDAAEHWAYLQQHTSSQCLDFSHAVSQVQRAARVLYHRHPARADQWVDEWCQRLQDETGAAARFLAELESRLTRRWTSAQWEELKSVVTFFINHQHQMDYAKRVAAGLPIRSDAACQTIVKMRLCQSAKWTGSGVGTVLSLRALSYTAGCWEQFWTRVNQHGFPALDPG